MSEVTVRDMTEQGGATRWTASGGYAQDRVYMVTFDDDGGVIEGDSRSRALDAMDVSGVPQNYAAHPVWKWRHLVLVSKDVEIKSSSQFIITCKYGRPAIEDIEPSDAAADAVISVGSTLVEAETSFDVDGNEIFTSHFDDTEGNPKKVRGSVSDHAVTMVVRYERKELGGAGGSLISLKALSHVGMLNSDESVFGDGPRTWLCSEISGTSTDSGVTYNVAYEFIRSPKVEKVGPNFVRQPWDVEIVEIDPDTGTFVTNPQTDRGKKVIHVKGEASFVGLNLTFA